MEAFLRRRGFSALFLHRTGTRTRLADRLHFWRGRHPPLDSSDDRPVWRAHRGHGHKLAFAPQAVDQSPFSWAQHLLGQRGEVPENPYQIRALREVGLNKSRADRRINLQNTAGEFFNPHARAYLNDTVEIALGERVIIAPDVGQWEEIFSTVPLWVRSGSNSTAGPPPDRFEKIFQLISGSSSMRSRVAATPTPFPWPSSTRTTDA